MVWKPEMPFAPVTMAVRSLMSDEKVGRLWKMPLSCRGRDLEPILDGAIAASKILERVERKDFLRQFQDQ